MNNRNFLLFSILFIGILALFFKPISCENKDDKRTRKIIKNPGCPPRICNESVHIVYIKSNSSKDVLHFLYSAGIFTQTPSVILMRSTDLSSKLVINWTNLISNTSKMDSVEKMGSNFTSLFGLVFSKLYQYDDTKDNLAMTGNITTWGFDKFKWDVTLQNNDIVFKSSSVNSDHNLFEKNDSFISLKFSYEENPESGKNMPKLFFNTNNTQFDFIVKNLKTFLNHPRFAVEFALININSTGEMKIDVVKSIDDESSPGVFKNVNYYGQSVNAVDFIQTFIQWKPVCYVKNDDFSINSVSVAKYINEPTKIINDVIKTSLVYYAYGDRISNTSASALNITFGISGDKYYKDYILWTASFGYGKPPTYDLSIAIIMIIIFGLGIPFLLVVIGSIYLVVKKRLNRKKSGSYGQIDEAIN